MDFNLKCTKCTEHLLSLNVDIFFCPHLLACSRISYGEFYSVFLAAFTPRRMQIVRINI